MSEGGVFTIFDGQKVAIGYHEIWVSSSGRQASYRVTLTYRDDPNRNPPDGEWVIDPDFSPKPGDIEPQLIDLARAFHDYLDRWNGPSYNSDFWVGKLTSVIADFRKKRQEDHANWQKQQREVQDLRDELRRANARIAELETEPIKTLEAANERLRAALSDIETRIGLLRNGGRP